MFFGVTWSLYLTNRPLNVVGLIGLIMLAGIVVNNAGVLVDYIETLRNGDGSQVRRVDGRSHQTASGVDDHLTTILGMFPLALGSVKARNWKRPWLSGHRWDFLHSLNLGGHPGALYANG